MIQELNIADIVMSNEVQARCQPDWVAISEYANTMKVAGKDGWPAVVVFFDGEVYWLADGFHRITAARDYAELPTFQADIRQGSKHDAQWYAMGANKSHGVRMKSGDNARILERIFADPEWAAVPVREIARHTGIPESTVRWSHEKLSAQFAQIEKPTKRNVTRNGRTYVQDTTAIGKSAPPVPEPPQAMLYEQAEERFYPLTDADIIEEHNSGSDEYYTPRYIIDAARAVMGEIDLDPASCERAQMVVQAAGYYNIDDDGLTKDWRGRVWLNPPFSDPKPFVLKAIGEHEAGNITEAIVLTNNGTETEWGQALLTRYPVCFVGHGGLKGSRISFWKKDPEEPRGANRYSQMIFYLGKNPERFYTQFSRFGAILRTDEG